MISSVLEYMVNAGVRHEFIVEVIREMEAAQAAAAPPTDLSSNSNTTTCVYVLSGVGPVKVGLSKHPEIRVKQVGRSISFELEVDTELWFESRDIAFEVEQKAHKILNPYRLGGEWFEVTSEIASAAIIYAASSYGHRMVQR